MIDPTAELLQAMAQVGLNPMRIQWDGVPEGPFHRFPGIGQERGDAGYYKAFVDQRSAIFGDWRTKEQWVWPRDNPRWMEATEHLKPLSAAEVEKQKRAAAAALAKAEKKDTRIILDLWARAKECKNHPYLEAKGIRNVSFLRSIIDPETEEDMLLIPMRNVQSEIRNIQRIWPDGTRLQMRQRGGSSGLYNTIGANRFKQSKTLYVCEGWATGWTIHLASNTAVIVAFFDSGLKTVGEIIQRRYPDAKLIFAADNDRWSFVPRNGTKVNPGVYAAMQAAEAVGGEYCIPDFPNLTDKPTDFDDLRQMTDLETVRKWLAPSMAKRAETKPPAEKKDTEAPQQNQPEQEPDEDAHWTETFPAQFLGSLGDTYYFLSERSGQILHFSAFRKTDLYKLAPLEWYEEHFGHETKRGNIVVNYDYASSALIDWASRTGTYGLDKVRGRGYWPEDDRPLLHLGDRLNLPDGEVVAPATYRQGNRIYPALPRLEGPGDRPLPLRTARWILGLFEDLLWEVPAAAYLAAGWAVLAPACGFLRWRPHIWVTGPAGCGKTSIIKDLIVPLMGDMGLFAGGKGTTEQGIRQELGTDALPVLIDEAGRESRASKARIGKIIELMRSAASTSGRVLKSTRHGKGLNCQIRSMFCLGSAGGVLRDPQDRQRISVLHLRHPRSLGGKSKQDAHWHQIQRELNRLSPRIAEMLLARTQQWARTGRLQRLLEITKRAVGAVLDNNRASDQYGTLFAGAFILLDDKMPDEESVIATMKDLGLQENIRDVSPEGREILDILFHSREVVSTSNGTCRMSVGEMIELVVRNSQVHGSEGLPGLGDAQRHLRNIGFVLDGGSLYVANKRGWISRVLAGTAFADDHASLLRVMPGAEPGGQRRFSGRKCRTTRIPLKCLDIP